MILQYMTLGLLALTICLATSCVFVGILELCEKIVKHIKGGKK